VADATFPSILISYPQQEGHDAPTPVSADESQTEAGHEPAAQPDNPILPVTGELIWATGLFILLWALMKFVLLKPIQKTMADRSAKIRGDLDAAETAKDEGVSSLSEYEASLASARAEASRIIDDARSQAEEQRKEILAAAEAEVAELRTAANAEVVEAKNVALASMRSNVATIAVQAAEAVVQKRLDAVTQRQIIDDYLNRVSPN
jgi:F-type H+-transporting ATPase subunit b